MYGMALGRCEPAGPWRCYYIHIQLAIPAAMFLKRMRYYLDPTTLFRKSEGNFNLRFMHGINRISIFMFLACVVVMLLRALARG